MTATKTRPTEVPAVDELEQVVRDTAAALEHLQAEQRELPAQRRALIVAGDVDSLLELQRRSDEFPTRLLVAEVALVQARITVEQRRATDLDAERTGLYSTVEKAELGWASVVNGRSEWSEREHARVSLDDARSKWQTVHNRCQALDRHVKDLRAELEEKLRPAVDLAAPVVRSIPHTPGIGTNGDRRGW